MLEEVCTQRRVPPTLGRTQRPHPRHLGVKYFHHHVVGDLTLAWESLDLRAEPGLTMTIYAAEPASSTEHAWRCSRPGPPLPTRLPMSRTQARANARRAEPKSRAILGAGAYQRIRRQAGSTNTKVRKCGPFLSPGDRI